MGKIKFTVEVAYKKVSGPKADPEEIHQAIEVAISDGAYDADISFLDEKGEGEYEVTDVVIREWEVGA